MIDLIANNERAYHLLTVRLTQFVYDTGFCRAIVGMSGGIDSALIACLCTDALGSHNVLGVTMPSQFSSQESIDDSKELAENLGIYFRNIPISPIYEAYEKWACGVFTEGGEFGYSPLIPKVIKDSNGNKYSKVTLAQENLQARIRANILMGFSNSQKALVINTCNLTEDLLGYATMYGDTIGAIAPLGNIGKLDVYKLAHCRENVIPKNCFTKAPSAELKPDQTDENSLPAPYEVLDPLTKELMAYTGEFAIRKDVEDIIIRKYGPVYGEDIVSEVYNLMKKNTYKMKQAPPAISCEGMEL